ncbi:hypothetical protein DPMN_189290 [Dreissena polymorpha]|uniref:Uncharacterized protein n=1 Tax=Dreissena polymorpha TaxID=45954 RepID=A0A9D4DUM4_DREPO|nr:hypothetical protein DPMN_189290 [Dreissena polymorpha]
MDIRSTSSKEDTENYPKILPEHMKIPRFMKVDEHCYEGVSDIDGVTYDDIYRLIPSAIRKSFFQPNFLCTVRNCNNLSGSEIKHDSHHSDKHPSAKCSYSCLNADAVAQMYEKTFYPFQSMFYCNVRGCNFLRFLPSMSDHFPQELKAHSEQHDYSFVKDENHCEKSCNSYFVCTACDIKLRTFQHYALHGNVCKISKNNNRLRVYIFKQCSDGCETTLCPVCSQGPFNQTGFRRALFEQS